jgi:ribonuclease P/MRP protein subunit POP5
MDEQLSLIISLISLALSVISIILIFYNMKYIKINKILKIERITKEKKRKRRYVVFQVISEGELTGYDIISEIKSIISKFWGETRLSTLNPSIIFYSNRNGILSVEKEGVDYIIASMGLIREIKGVKTLIIPKITVGTIRKAKKLVK